MTLLPIIYTSVLIFSAFLLFIIIISYISYKTKLRVGLTRNIEHANRFDHSIVVRPAYINNNVRKPIQLQVQNTFYGTRNLNIPHIQPRDNRIYQPTAYMDSRRNNSNHDEKYFHNNEHSEHIEKNEIHEERKLKRYETQSLTHRLEIMNSADGLRKTQEKDHNINSNHNSNIDEINLFNYYSDNSELDFVALSANRVSQSI